MVATATFLLATRAGAWSAAAEQGSAPATEVTAAPPTAPLGNLGSVTLTLLAPGEGGALEPVTAEQSARPWVNRARCECDETLELSLSLDRQPGAEHAQRVANLWLGSECHRAAQRASGSCVRITAPRSAAPGDGAAAAPTLQELATGHRIALKARAVVGAGAAPGAAPAACPELETTRELWLLLDDSGDTPPEQHARLPLTVDTRPPAAGFTATLAPQADSVLITTAGELAPEETIQALCAVEHPGQPLRRLYAKPRSEPAFATCTPAVDVDAENRPGPLDDAQPDPNFVCGTLTGPSWSLPARRNLLAAGDTLAVRLVVSDRAGNHRTVTPTPSSVLPEQKRAFWDLYREAGGSAETGCGVGWRGSSGAAGALVALAALLLWRRRRRASGSAALLLLAVAMAVPPPALAQPVEPEVTPVPRPEALPSAATIELKAGPYYPGVDEEFDGATPYGTYFGSKKSPLGQVELDVYVLRRWGHLGLTFGAGFTRRRARMCLPVTTPAEEPPPAEEVEGDEMCDSRVAAGEGGRVSFRVFPFSVGLVYRLTQLVELTPYLPLVPYVKAGLNAYHWSTKDAYFTRVSGTTFGWQASAGLALRMDVLEPNAAAYMRELWGIVHTSLFFELTRADVDGLGQSNKLHLSDDSWSAGLGFDF
jgi:hypothetical protein